MNICSKKRTTNLQVSQCLTKTEVYSLPEEIGVCSKTELYSVPFAAVGAAKARAAMPFPRSAVLKPLGLPGMLPTSIGLHRVSKREPAINE
jgi:hypothetical protein